MLSYKRSTRVAELLQQEIARLVQEIKISGIGLITITGVKLTDDLLEAHVFYSVIGSPEEVQKAKEVIEESIQEIRHQIALRINLRRTPSFKFLYDDTPEKAAHIFQLLEKIKDEDKEGTSSGTVTEKKKK